MSARRSHGLGLWGGMLLAWLWLPAASAAQSDSTGPRLTLREWAESSWLQVLDRNGTDGRFSELGILQRFHEDIDGEYQLDLLAARFSFTEELEWYQRSSGFRWRGGSITKRDLATVLEFKHTAPLSEALAFGVRFDRQTNPTTNRGFLRIGFERRFESGISAFAVGSLDANKSGSDLALGVRYRSTAVPQLEGTISFEILDWVNDLIYLGLNAAEQGQIDSTIEYEKQPLALRASVSSPIGNTIRLEAYGAVMFPATVLQYREQVSTEGLRQREEYKLLGGLAELSIAPNVVAGLFGTIVEARSERSALTPGLPVSEYSLVERTSQLGAMSVVRFGAAWNIELQISRNWRPEQRDFVDPDSTDVDYLDRAWTGQLLFARSVPHGFLFDLSVLWDRRDVVRGDRQVPSSGPIGEHNYRARFDIGWRAGPRFFVLAGLGVDLDGDGVGRYFGGGRGRFGVYW